MAIDWPLEAQELCGFNQSLMFEGTRILYQMCVCGRQCFLLSNDRPRVLRLVEEGQ